MDRRSLPRVALALALLLFAGLVVKDAWVAEDAYITFRTIDNWKAGYGLRWNAVERVQTYTHPLWMLVVAGSSSLTGDYLFTVIGLAVLASLGVVGLLAAEVARSPTSAALGILTLSLSKAFVDYSTSGLENPLTHLLLVAMIALWVGGGGGVGEKLSNGRVTGLGLITGLVALTRPDAMLLCLPVLATALLRARALRAMAAAAVGCAPLVAWELFSVIYYGFPFPNTAYAKLGTGIAPMELTVQGFRYLGDSLAMDPITMVAIFLGATAAFLPSQRNARPLGIGVLLYLAFVVMTGGDFMSGRFLTAPLICAVAILVQLVLPSTRTALLGFAAVVAIGLGSSRSPLLGGRGYGLIPGHTQFRHGIADERAHFFQYTGLFNVLGGSGPEQHDWAILGREMRDFGPSVAAMGNVGFAGFFAGPELEIVDRYGLGDPLLARLPVTDASTWRPGHFDRELPRGYLESLRDSGSAIADPGLAEYAERLHGVTRGRIFSRARLVELVRLNLGRGSDAVDRQREYAALLTLGSRSVYEQRWSEALPHLERAVAIDPTRASGWCRLGQALEGAGELEAARRAVLECIDADPYDLDSRQQHVALAGSMDDRDGNRGLFAVCREAVAIRPQLLEVHMLVANMLLRHDLAEESLAVSEEAVRADLPTARFRDLRGGTFASDYRTRLRATLRFNRAAALSRLGRSADAVAELREAIRIQPDFEAARVELEALSARDP